MPQLSDEEKIARRARLKLETDSLRSTQQKRIKNPPIQNIPMSDPTTTPDQNINPTTEQPAVEKNVTPPVPEKTIVAPAVNDELPFGKGNPNINYDPFEGNAEERSYSTPVIDTNINTEIPAALYELPSVNAENIEASLSKPGGSGIPGQDESKPASTTTPSSSAAPASSQQPSVLSNPTMNEMTPEERLISATQMADTILNGYDKLHQLGRFVIKRDEDKLVQKHKRDEIDLNMRLPVEMDANGIIKYKTLGEWTKNFNEEVDQEFILTNDFKMCVRPALIRTCVKHNWGLNDDHFILLKFSEDAATKIAMMVSFNKAINNLYEMFEQAHEENKKILLSRNITPEVIQTIIQPISSPDIQTPADKIAA